MYQRDRYLTLTGNRWPDAPSGIAEQTAALGRLHAAYVARRAQPQNGSSGDDALIERARNAKNGDRFSALFDRGDLRAHQGDHSSADLGLCNLLAFWTDRNAHRMDGLFRRSRLYRQKWDERHAGDGSTYGQITINRALADCRETYSEHPRQSQTLAPASNVEMDIIDLRSVRIERIEWLGRRPHPLRRTDDYRRSRRHRKNDGDFRSSRPRIPWG